jgi:hypothetical protein
LNESPTRDARSEAQPVEEIRERRAFRDPNELFDWLSEVLDVQERARLREILAGHAT